MGSRDLKKQNMGMRSKVINTPITMAMMRLISSEALIDLLIIDPKLLAFCMLMTSLEYVTGNRRELPYIPRDIILKSVR
jgi:hypothetical protein